MLARANINAGCLVTRVVLAHREHARSYRGALRQVHGLVAVRPFLPCSTAHATTCVVS